MKNSSLIINALLAVAVAVLYILHFTQGGKAEAQAEPVESTDAQTAGVRIAYINADTLDAKYEWLKEQKTAIEQRMRSAEKSLNAKKEKLMTDMAAFQKRYESGTVAPAKLEQEYNALMKRQQQLADEETYLVNSLAEEQQKAMNELMTTLEEKLQTLQSELGYDYILSYSKGGGQVLLANDSLDVTERVLKLLNAKAEQESPSGGE
jgi:outer membrane protein